jgi:adenylate cyclase
VGGYVRALVHPGTSHSEPAAPLNVSLSDDISKSITTILDATWNIRDGQVVPETDDVVLANGAVKLDATFLYADLANSTRLARQFDKRVAAKIVRAFLSSVTRLINEAGGKVRSFDGDRSQRVSPLCLPQ